MEISQLRVSRDKGLQDSKLSKGSYFGDMKQSLLSIEGNLDKDSSRVSLQLDQPLMLIKSQILSPKGIKNKKPYVNKYKMNAPLGSKGRRLKPPKKSRKQLLKNSPIQETTNEHSTAAYTQSDKNESTSEMSKSEIVLEKSLNFFEAQGFKDPKKNEEVTFIFNKRRDRRNLIPYHRDGRPIMYTKVNMQKRKELKKDKLVQRSIKRFIESYNLDHNDELGKKEYFRIQGLIARILRQDLSAEQRQELVLQDWIRDSQGHKTMDKELLKDALYEMADIWTPDIEVSQIVSLFAILKFKIQYEDYEDEEDQEKKKLKNAYDIM